MLEDFIKFAAYGADFKQFGPYTRPAEPNQPPGFWFQPPLSAKIKEGGWISCYSNFQRFSALPASFLDINIQ